MQVSGVEVTHSQDQTILKLTVLLVACAFLMNMTRALAAPLEIAGTPTNLVINEVEGGRSIRIDLVPLDASGKAKPSPPSLALADVAVKETMLVQKLDPPMEVVLRGLKVSWHANPVTISIHRENGKLLQEIVIKDRKST